MVIYASNFLPIRCKKFPHEVILLTHFLPETFLSGIEALKHSFPESMANWMTTWPVLGLLFMLAGLSHFSSAEGKY